MLSLQCHLRLKMAKFEEADPRWKVKDLGDKGTNVNGWHWTENDMFPWFKDKFGEMFDDKLTTAELTAIFTRVNARSLEEEEGDDDAEELDFVEFLEVLARMCNAKYPEADRDGESFATCLQSFLHLIFLPTYKKLLKKRTEMRG